MQIAAADVHANSGFDDLEPIENPSFGVPLPRPQMELAGLSEILFGDAEQRKQLKTKIDALLPELLGAVETTFPELAGTIDKPKITYVDSEAGRIIHGFIGDRVIAIVREEFGNRIFVNVDALHSKPPEDIAQTLLHEMFHIYTGSALKAIKFLGGSIKFEAEGFRTFKVQDVIAEGGAEYFARKVSDATGDFGPKDKNHPYQNYESAFRAAVQIVGEDTARSALFDRKADDINRLVGAVVQVFNEFDPEKASTCDIYGNCDPFRR